MKTAVQLYMVRDCIASEAEIQSTLASIKEAGYDAMVYAGQYVSYIKYDQGALEPYLSWYPEYKSTSSEQLYPTLYYHRDYWQYSSSGTVDGIGGNVDLNLQFISR